MLHNPKQAGVRLRGKAPNLASSAKTNESVADGKAVLPKFVESSAF